MDSTIRLTFLFLHFLPGAQSRVAMTSNLASRLKKRIDKLEDRRSLAILTRRLCKTRATGPSARQGESEGADGSKHTSAKMFALRRAASAR
jgi:hypothetical protein